MKRILLVFMILTLTYTGFSQGKIKKKRTLNEDVFFGGIIGLKFGTFTGFEIAPMAGYKPMKNMYTGMKFTYQYISSVDNTIIQNVYGGSLFADYVFFRKAIGHVEYEMLNIHVDIEDNSTYANAKYDFWYSAPLVGGGLYQPMGNRSALVLMALFDVSGSPKSIYNNPILRITILF